MRQKLFQLSRKLWLQTAGSALQQSRWRWNPNSWSLLSSTTALSWNSIASDIAFMNDGSSLRSFIKRTGGLSSICTTYKPQLNRARKFRIWSLTLASIHCDTGHGKENTLDESVISTYLRCPCCSSVSWIFGETSRNGEPTSHAAWDTKRS